MSILLVPHTVAADHAHVWLGGLDVGSPPRGVGLTLAPGDRPVAVPDDGWRPVSAGGALPATGSFVQAVRIDGLAAGTRYRVAGPDGGTAFFSTLPDRLPTGDELPLSILLGSCFFQGRDQEGQVGAAFQRVPAPFAPQFKVLAGDQVYLDLFHEFGVPIATIFSKAAYAAHGFEKYRRTWSQPTPSFQTLLRQGGAFLTADDHEFWNNSPNWQLQLPATLRQAGRDDWLDAARSLFEAFQSDDPARAGRVRRFEIGDLSFFVADTRVHRAAGDRTFMRDDDFDALVAWLHETGPGVLVIGQPLFQKPSGRFMRRLADRALANYAQYAALVRAIVEGNRSLLLLSGDVHYGRVATATLRRGGRERQLHEVISSPLSLLSGRGRGDGKAAPEQFPPDAIGGVSRVRVTTLARTGQEQFATLHLSSRGGRVVVHVRYWFTKARPGEPRVSEPIGPLLLD